MSGTRGAVLLLLAMALGCGPAVQRRDWSTYEGPAAAAFHRGSPPPPDFPDPLEPVNRSVAAVNHALVVGLVDPLGRGYRAITPRVMRERIRDFGANLVFPRNLTANLLQGRWRQAGDVTARFGINTTLGVAGFWDPAARWFDIAAAPEDFGQVFATWGWRPSTHAVLPVYGPSSVRDGVGLLPDAVLDPATYFFPLGPALLLNEQVDSLDEYRRFVASSFDPYDDARVLWGFAREARIDPPPSPSRPVADTGAVQTLQAAFFGPRDPAFARTLSTGRALVSTTGLSLPYSYRPQPGRAPLVYIVPGLGTHRLSATSVALAEMAWSRGFSVVIVSSAFNPEFITRAASMPVPGHAPYDARDVRVALDAVSRDLDRQDPGRVDGRVYLGYSLGAFHGFYIAAAEAAGDDGLVRFDRYLLVDPPVRLAYGLERLDQFYDVPLALPPASREAAARRIVLKAVAAGQEALVARTGAHDYSRVDAVDLSDGLSGLEVALPFANDEAEYLIGLAFRRSLISTLWASQERDDLGVLRTERRRMRRLPAYREMGEYSFTMYLHAFVVPYYRDRLRVVGSVDDLVRANDLRAIAPALRRDPRLRVFANHNDFLTSDDDVAWLTATLGRERVRLFPAGGHLGNLHRPEVQAEIMAALSDLGAERRGR